MPDAHRDQVMRARDNAVGAAARRYFGYGTILDRDAFLEWRSQHGYDFFQLPEGKVGEALDVALVYDFPSRWWGGRVAGLSDEKGKSVFGRLYEIAGSDWPIIQHKEGVVTGMCVEREVRVSVGGEIIIATAFTTSPDRRSLEGPVSDRFVKSLVSGARAAALPEAWIESIPRDAH
jgi:gamma-glutamylcyclotransferase